MDAPEIDDIAGTLKVAVCVLLNPPPFVLDMSTVALKLFAVDCTVSHEDVLVVDVFVAGMDNVTDYDFPAIVRVALYV